MPDIINKLKQLKKFDVPLAAAAAWIISLSLLSFVSVDFLSSIEYASGQSMLTVLLMTLFIFVAILAAATFNRIVIFITLVAAFLVYGTYASYISMNAYTALGFSLVMLAVLLFSSRYFELEKYRLRLGRRASVSIVALFAICSFLYVSVLTVFRYLSYIAPCFDFGIFTQMFDNMREGLGPVTTCERGELLSHFAVHFSPIYYLILPVYYVFPSPVTLAVAQGAILASGVIPLYLIGKKIGLSNTKNVAICILYSAFPALIGGCFYDIHENVFLAPLVLWVMYFIETEKYIPVLLFSILTLGVKEDAVIYVASIALYIFFGRRKRIWGAVIFAASVAYFFTVAHFMTSGGDGIMLGGRYYNVIGKDGGFFDLVRAVIVNPAIYVIESFTAEKLLYLLLVLAPLGFLPLIGPRVSELLLLVPLVVVNLISDYQYQHDIGFQYVFGSSVLLFYMAAKNLQRLRSGGELARILVAYGACAALFIGGARFAGQSYGVNKYISDRDEIAVIEQTLSEIDKDREIGASTMLVAHLWDVNELYSLEFYTRETECVILDLRDHKGDIDAEHERIAEYLLRGYEIEEHHEGIIAVLGRAEAGTK